MAAPLSRLQSSALASVARCAERYEDMRMYMSVTVRAAAEANDILTTEERELFSAAFKDGLTRARSALRIFGVVVKHEANPALRGGVLAYVQKVADEVLALADTVIDLAVAHSGAVCEELLIPRGDAVGGAGLSALPSRHTTRDIAEAAVFSFMLAADYCRYVAETHYAAATVALYSDRALVYYSRARTYAYLHLYPARPALLSAMLNFSVFLYEVRKCEDEARDLADAALREALDALRSSARLQKHRHAAAIPGTGTTAAEADAFLTPAEALESQAVMAALAENLHVWGAGVVDVGAPVVGGVAAENRRGPGPSAATARANSDARRGTSGSVSRSEGEDTSLGGFG